MTDYWQPTGAQKAKLRKALLDAFDDPSFTLLISDYFTPESYTDITSANRRENRLQDVINYARMNDWLLDLVAAARERRPTNPAIADIAEELGLTVLGARLDNPTGQPFEEIIQENATILNPVSFREKIPVLEGQVCWVDVPGGGGTGFLVGPDLVLTNYHVIERVQNGQARRQDVRFVFDFKTAADGTTLDRKHLPSVSLLDDQANWLVHSSPTSQYDWTPNLGDAGDNELDYALLRLAEKIGDLPVGGDTVDEKAMNQPRGWIDVKIAPPALVAGNQVFLLQHPKGEPLGLSIGTVTEFNAAGTRVRYDANSKDGSSGSPCFNADLQLVALHHAFDTAATPPRWNQAVPLASIQAAWSKSSVTV